MSAQTGTPSFVPPAPSARPIDLARASLRRAKSEPNPIWIRELKQAARLQRTPAIFMTITALSALFMCALGGMLSVSTSPATIGVALFHTFFSVAFFVVMLVGPALAANSVASEREGRTWEAVILTGLPPKSIAKGKFLSSFTAISLHVVMLAPVSALPFLFGGVTAFEVMVAFAFLFLFATLSVAFGLAISSTMTSVRSAIVLTLLLSFPLTLAIYLGLGVGLSFVAHEAWPAVLRGPPVWLPTAYERAPLSLEYATFLFLIPVACVVLPAWFLYEVTVANLMSVTDDRSSGLKRWFVIMTPMLLIASAVPAATTSLREPSIGFVVAMSVMALFLVFCIFVFQGDSLGPSRKVLAHWQRRNAGWFVRFLGPGLVRTSLLVLIVGLAALGALMLLGVAMSAFSPTVGLVRWLEAEKIASYFQYAASYFLFLVGLAAWLRARASGPGVARLFLGVAIFVTSVGPWIAAAIAGLWSSGRSGANAAVVAAPSPFFAFVLLDGLNGSKREVLLLSGAISSVAWSLIGLGLLASAAERSKAVIAKHEKMLATVDRMLEQEENAVQASPEDVAPMDEASSDAMGPAT